MSKRRGHRMPRGHVTGGRNLDVGIKLRIVKDIRKINPVPTDPKEIEELEDEYGDIDVEAWRG